MAQYSHANSIGALVQVSATLTVVDTCLFVLGQLYLPEWQSRAVAARQAHNLKVAGSSPASATNGDMEKR